MKDLDFVLVEKDKFVRLLKDSLELLALNQGGVDNWEWHGGSISTFIENFLNDNPNFGCSKNDIKLKDIAEYELEKDYDIINLEETFEEAKKQKEQEVK